MVQIKRPQFEKRTILYYPTIDVPPSSWLRQALLYWDGISSIVPKDYDGNPVNELSPVVQVLIAEGEFNPIHPEELIFDKGNWEAFKKFENEFLEIVLSPEYETFLQENYYGTYKGNPHAKHWSRIHKNKTSSSLSDSLYQKGLAKQDDEHQWHLFETNTALLYMSLLAKHLAKVQTTSTIIGTDYSIYEELNFKKVSDDVGVPVVSLSLNKLLPVPEDDIPFERILAFKRERKSNLVKFRKIILDHQMQITNAESVEHIKDIVVNFKEDLFLGIEDLEKAMKSSKITSSLKSIRSLLNLAKYPAIADAGTFAEEKLNLPTGSLSLSALAATAAIEFGFNYIENRLEHSGKLRDSAFSYVYEAQRAGIVKSV
jgi:hypothetical protein